MHPSQEYWFDHDKLEVYREAILFIGWLSALLEGTVRIGEVKDQLDRASTSIPLNIVRMLMGLIMRNSTRDYERGNVAN